MFSPQKGASKKEIEALERALTRLADVGAKEFGFDYRDEADASAAGGLAFGLMSFCGAKIRPGLGGIANYLSGSCGNTLLFELGPDADNEVFSGDLDHRLRSFRCIAPGGAVTARDAEVTTEL